jgi:hypothetical protein
MSAKLTRIHLGLSMAETGVQFELTDDNGLTTTQRGFVTLTGADEALAAVWLAVQIALDAQLGALPLDLPPAAVTTALMQKRNAENETRKAQAALAAKEAEITARVAADNVAKAEAEAALVTVRAEVARLDAVIAERAAAVAAPVETVTR